MNYDVIVIGAGPSGIFSVFPFFHGVKHSACIDLFIKWCYTKEKALLEVFHDINRIF